MNIWGIVNLISNCTTHWPRLKCAATVLRKLFPAMHPEDTGRGIAMVYMNEIQVLFSDTSELLHSQCSSRTLRVSS